MKRFKFYAILLAMVTIVACSDDFDPLMITDLETDTFTFAPEGGEQTFLLESNEQWSVGEVPNWITVVVADEPATRSGSISYEKGKKSITIKVEENPDPKVRSTDLMLISVSEKMVKLTITQQKRPELAGYWILSEGYNGSFNSELAWFDAASGELKMKQFKELNGKDLGDTGNALKIYGSKMYVLVSGPGFGAETAEGTSYIEVINPIDGKSIKRIPFNDAKGTPSKPRNLIFEGGYGYISSYSNEVARLDTATLALDKHAALSGTLAEGLTHSNGSLYICNGGQGKDSTISVVDIVKMKETKVISTVKNPNHIVTVSNGDIYFNTDFNSDGTGYKLYKLKVADGNITEIPGLSVADLTYDGKNIYTSYYDWGTSKGVVNEFDISTAKAVKLNLNLGSAEYHIGTINGSKNLYLTGMEDDVVIFDPTTKEIKHTFKTGTPGGSGVVAVFK